VLKIFMCSDDDKPAWEWLWHLLVVALIVHLQIGLWNTFLMVIVSFHYAKFWEHSSLQSIRLVTLVGDGIGNTQHGNKISTLV
jgi:hypothetical protein